MKSCAGQLGAELPTTTWSSNLELNSQLGERRQTCLSITSCPKSTADRFIVREKYCSFAEKVRLIRQTNRANNHPCLEFTSVSRSQRFRYCTSAWTETPPVISQIHCPFARACATDCVFCLHLQTSCERAGATSESVGF